MAKGKAIQAIEWMGRIPTAVPRDLQARVKAHSTLEAISVNPALSLDMGPLNVQRLDDYWTWILEIFHEATECSRFRADEAAWCEGVVGIVLRRAVDLSNPLLQTRAQRKRKRRQVGCTHTCNPLKKKKNILA